MSTHDLVITRTFDAPVEQVWNAWTDSAAVKQWWGPDGFTCPLAQMDVREGGTSLVSMSSPQFGTHYSIWHYQEIIPMQRIEYVHNLADQDGNKINPVDVGMPHDFPQDQRHVISFRPVGENQTELTITEYGWTEGEMMKMSRMGMEQCLDKMAHLLR